MERHMGRMLRNTSLSRMVQIQSESDWRPAVDVYETERDMCVCVDTAGVDMDNLSIEVQSNSVTISGLRHRPLRENLCRIHQLEIEHGYFKRFISFQLEIEHGYFKRFISFSVPINVAETASRCVNGILEIRMAKVAR